MEKFGEETSWKAPTWNSEETVREQ